MSPQKRLALIKRVQMGNSVRDVCKNAGISRKSYYKWKKRLSINGQDRASLGSLKDLPRGGSRILKSGKRYRGELTQEMILEVLECAGQNPLLSAHKISHHLRNKLGHLAPGPHGVQNVLKRHNLNTVSSRLVYQQSLQRTDKILVPQASSQTQVVVSPRLGEIQMQEMSTPPPNEISSGYLANHLPNLQKTTIAPEIISVNKYNKVVKILILLASYASGIFIFQLFFAIVRSPNPIGTIFAAISITLGTFFFLYSMKYYLSIAMVLIFSRTQQTKDPSERRGLETDLTNVTLKRQPFISIHLPLFNEKKVVNRLLQAVTSMEYEAFEVIVLDDSTDETKQIVEEWRNHPKVKIVHRDNRSGFKGGALHEAITVMDGRTEFVLVFDADFLPYPDTLTQFIKYFKSLEVLSGENEHLNPNSPIAAIQGYQWHVLNKSENWITRGVRSEYSGSYVIERSSAEIYQGLKQIAGSVFMIRADVIRQPAYSWGRSITEDFELTLKLYRDGWKVVYTPYIQSPSECVSTLKRLVRQRMRWAEGHSFNIRKYFRQLMFGFWAEHSTVVNIKPDQQSTSSSATKTWVKSRLSLLEKLEFLYLAPYYLQSFFFLVGTFSWFISESVFGVSLPFWTEVWGWSLVFTNLLSLPLMNVVGLFLEESEEKDFAGIASFVLLTYFLAPFQAYAALKGFLEDEEGTWFRTPKTGKITDVYKRSRFYKWFARVFPTSQPVLNSQVLKNVSFKKFDLAFRSAIAKKSIGNIVLSGVLVVTTMLMSFSPYITAVPTVRAEEPILAKLYEPSFSVENKSKIEEISQPQILRIPVNDEYLEYIFHKEPKVRTKVGKHEVEIDVRSINQQQIDLHPKAYKQEQVYIYENIAEKIDSKMYLSDKGLKTDIVLKSPVEMESVEFEIKTDLEAEIINNEVYFFENSKDKNSAKLWLFKIDKPYMYEERDPQKPNFGVEYLLTKRHFGWELKKVLTQEGKKWLSDSARTFPVIIDPTVNSVVQTSIDDTSDSRWGSPARKVAYMPNATGGAAWYTAYADGGLIVVEKCLVSAGCEATGDWSVVNSDLDDADADTDNKNISLWKEGDVLYIAWFDNGSDMYQFNTFNTTSDTDGTTCSGSDKGSAVDVYNSIAVADNGDVYIAITERGAGDGTADLEGIARIANGGCTETDITAGSGMVQRDSVEILTIGNDAFFVINDNGIGLRLSVYVDGSGWVTTGHDINGGTADVDIVDISAITDGTDIWVFQRNGTTGDSEFYKCSSCPTTSMSFSALTDPWSAGNFTAAGEVGLTYLSTTNEVLVAMVDDQAGANNFKIRSKRSNADTISWIAEKEFDISSQDITINHFSMTANVGTEEQAAVIYQEGAASELEFSTVPENLWVMMAVLPILPVFLRKWRKKKVS